MYISTGAFLLICFFVTIRLSPGGDEFIQLVFKGILWLALILAYVALMLFLAFRH